MSTETKEIGNKAKDVNVGIVQMMDEWKLKEQAYKEFPKDKLIDRLILCEIELGAKTKEADEHSMELWYFVGDETGAKYLSDEAPKMYFFTEKGVSQPNKDGKYTFKPNKIWLTDGEINIRVPKKMEPMFPTIKYGDSPIKVKLANITH